MNRSLPVKKRAKALYVEQPAMRVSLREGCSISQLNQFSLEKRDESCERRCGKEAYVRCAWAIASELVAGRKRSIIVIVEGRRTRKGLITGGGTKPKDAAFLYVESQIVFRPLPETHVREPWQ
jgi:hypothetical protein